MLGWLLMAWVWVTSPAAQTAGAVVCVDALEGEWAVLVTEGGLVRPVARSSLPAGALEGDCLEGGARSTGVTLRHRKEASDLIRSLEGGDRAAGGAGGGGR